RFSYFHIAYSSYPSEQTCPIHRKCTKSAPLHFSPDRARTPPSRSTRLFAASPGSSSEESVYPANETSAPFDKKTNRTRKCKDYLRHSPSHSPAAPPLTPSPPALLPS